MYVYLEKGGDVQSVDLIEDVMLGGNIGTVQTGKNREKLNGK